MITKVYAHIMDEDRRINAQRFEETFYSNLDLRKSKPPKESQLSQTVDINPLIEQMKQAPNLINAFAAMALGQQIFVNCCREGFGSISK